MRLRDDTRGVTVQVGAILLFAVLVVLLSIYQAQVVPAQNEGTEFQHSQAVHSDLVHLRDGLLRTAASGSAFPTSVALGTRYRPRVFFVNPAPVSAQLDTKPLGNVTVHGATASGDAGAYWDGSDHNYSTEAVVYDPSYAYLQRQHVTLENSGVFSAYASGNVTNADPAVVDGSTITLVTLTGNLSTAGVRTTALDPTPVSAPMRSVRVTNGSRPLNVTIPSTATRDQWNQSLADRGQLVSQGGNVSAVVGVDSGVKLVFAPGDYTLKMGRVGLGTGAKPYSGASDAAYIVHDSAPQVTMYGNDATIRVRVLDAYNNPVRNVRVTASNTSWFASGSRRTDADGVASFTYTANHSHRVTLSYGGNNSSRERVKFDVIVRGGTAADRVHVSGASGTSSGTVSFDLTNGGASSVTVTRLAVNSTSNNAKFVNGNPTVRIGGSGVYSNRITIGGNAADVTDTTLGDGSKERVVLETFKMNKNNAVDMSGQRLTVTLYFADGSSKRVTLST